MTKLEKEYAAWRQENNEFGNSAFNRFMMAKFLAGLNDVAPGKYVFKGGNLLWHYIGTPRPTVDLDFSTETNIEIAEVLSDIGSVQMPEVVFSVKRHEEKKSDIKIGLAAQIQFATKSGASNSFGIDIVFALPTHQSYVKVLNRELKAASIENIILDKVSACHRFGDGNTRMKDFDDLYRISLSNVKVRPEILKMLADQRKVVLDLDPRWASGLESSWDIYITRKNYKAAKDLPRDIGQVIETIRHYLKTIQS